MTTLIEARGLTVGYSGVPVVRGIDVRVDAGEVVALLGPNGAGKTTTLLALAGELPLLGGSVDIDGAPAAGRLDARVRGGMAFIPEERGVIKALTVAENLRLGLGTVEAALALAPELEPLLRRRAGLLSGGEQQILTLARALAAEPRVVLADEMSLGLAPKVVGRMLRIVRETADRGAGVLLVEQHAGQALEVADRGYVLRRGVVDLAGSANDLVARIAEIEDLYLAGRKAT